MPASPDGTGAELGNHGSGEQTQTLGDTASGPAPLAVRVRILNAPAQPATFRLSAGICRIGAGEGVNVLVHDKTVSRVHAELELVREGVAVRDLDSRNGTYLYGQRIQSAVLCLGSRVKFGRVEAEIAPDLAPEGLPLHSSDSYGRMVGGSAPMRRLYSLLSRLEGSLASVLITGETGTGKEVAARALHDRSHVARGPFISVNCGALDKSLARSELFGHARGAFTGAIESRAGAFEAANGGTLFLDEIGELPLDVQPLLLRAVEQGVVVRVGESQERVVKVRLLAATHRDLQELVQQGRFREDLYYRLMVVKVTLPPLRDRLDDVPLLIARFCEQLGVPAPAPEVIERLRRGGYPGNVRELRNAVEAHAAVGSLPESSRETAPELESVLRRYIAVEEPYAPQKEELLRRFLDLYIDLLLAHTSGNQSEAARLSGLERSYLNRVLKRRKP